MVTDSDTESVGSGSRLGERSRNAKGSGLLGLSIIACGIAVIAMRGILAMPGAMGRNWDWIIPGAQEGLAAAMDRDLALWNENLWLGNTVSVGIANLPFNYVFHAVGYYFLGGAWLSKSVVAGSLIGGAVGFYLQARMMLSREGASGRGLFWASACGGLFYGCSPFMFNEWHGGSYTQIIADALMPYAVWLVWRAAEREGGLADVHAVTMLTVITISLQRLVEAVFLGLVLVLWTGGLRGIWRLKTVAIGYVILNIYWLLPTASVWNNVEQVAFSGGMLTWASLVNNAPSLQDAFVGLGYYRDFASEVIGSAVGDVYRVVFAAIVSALIGTVVLIRPTKLGLAWATAFVCAVGIGAVGRSPLAPAVYWAYGHLPFMTLFRSPQHLLVIVSFLLAGLISFGIYRAWSAVEPRGRKWLIGVRSVSVVMVGAWILPTWWPGDLGLERLQQSNRPGLSVFKNDPEYLVIARELAGDRDAGRVLVLPTALSPKFIENEFQRNGQGSDPAVQFLPKPTVVWELSKGKQKHFVEGAAKEIYNGGNSALVRELLDEMSIKYIFLRSDVNPHFEPYAREWSYEKVSKYLDSKAWMKKRYDGERMKLYEVENWSPRVVALGAEDVVEKRGLGHEGLYAGEGEIVALRRLGNWARDGSAGGNDRITGYERVSPARYKVSVSSDDEPFWLIFREGYHPGWRAYVERGNAGGEGDSGAWVPLLMRRSPEIPGVNHRKVDDWANGWLVEPNKILGRGEEGEPDTRRYVVVLEYGPQRLLELGGLLSISGFVGWVLLRRWTGA